MSKIEDNEHIIGWLKQRNVLRPVNQTKEDTAVSAETLLATYPWYYDGAGVPFDPTKPIKQAQEMPWKGHH